MFAGDEPGSQEGDSTAVQIPCKILSRGRRRGTDTRYHTSTFLSTGEKPLHIRSISIIRWFLCNIFSIYCFDSQEQFKIII